jgi:hypothetical protein
MKKRDEKLVDSRLEKMGIEPRIYHFKVSVWPFRAITIATTGWSWGAVRRIIDQILANVISRFEHERSTTLLQELRNRGIYGVSICEQRDQLNRQRGRTIAKGRLWKHLKRMEKEQ